MDASDVISYGYTGTSIFFIEKDVIVFTYGNTLKFMNLKTGATKNIVGTGKGISALTVNRRLSRIAYAEKGKDPKLHLLSYPDNRIIFTYEGGSSLEYNDICFSREGNRLAAVSCLPECKLLIWNSLNPKSTPIIQVPTIPTLSLTGRFTLSFNPKNSNQLCVTGYGKVTLFKLDTNIEQYKVNDVYSTEITISNGNETKEETEQELNILSHLWDSNNQLYIATGDKKLFKYDSVTLKLVESIPLKTDHCVTTLAISKHSLITGLQSGRLSWLSLSQKYQLDYALEFLDPISHVAFSPDYSYLIIGTIMGGLHSLNIGEDAAPTKGKPVRVLDCHKGDITGIAAFPLQHFAVTCGVDGCIRIWDYTKAAKNTSPIYKLQLDTSLSCVATNRKNHIFAVGGDNGVVRIYEAHNVRRPLLLNSTKVHSGKITSVKFSLSGKHLATGGVDNKVCLMDVSVPELPVLGYVPLPGPVLSIYWNLMDAVDQLFIAVDHDSGDIFRIVPPEKPLETVLLKNRDVQKSLLKLNWTALGLCMDPRSAGTKKQYFFCMTTDKKLKRYNMPERTGDPDLMDDSDIAPPKEEYKGHEKIGSALQTSGDGKWIASGAQDGLVILRPLATINDTRLFKGHSSATGGVTGVTFSFDSQYILSIGGNTFYARPVPGSSPANGEEWVGTAFTEIKEIYERKEEPSAPTYLEAQLKIVEDNEDMIHKKAKKQNLDWIAKLRNQVNDLVNRNANAPEIEQLDTLDLVVDLEEKEKLTEEGDAAVQELKENLQTQNLVRDLFCHRIKMECWDSLEEQSIVLRGFKRKVAVANYPLRKRHEEDIQILKRITLQRKIELKEFRMRKQPIRVNSSVSNVFLNGSMREIDISAAAQMSKKSKKEVQETEDTLEEEDSDKIQDLLYHDLDLHTPQRRVNQIHMLKWIIYERKKEFNKEILNILETKKNEIMKIQEKNERIREIHYDRLNLPPAEFFQPQLVESEIPESVFQVQDSEVKAQRYLAPEEEQLRRDRELQKSHSTTKKEDSADRGLRLMMGGVLEGKMANQQIEEDLVRPEHLNKPEKEMKEEEIRELREFEKKLEVIAQEKEKQRKALETELKKLHSQILEICNLFDETLQRLYLKKMQVDQQVFEDELKIIKLSQALLLEEKNDRKEQMLIQELANLKQQKVRSTTKLTEFKREHEQAKEVVEMLVAEDKAFERTVKKDLEKDHEEYSEILFKLFKKRTRVSPSEKYNTTTESNLDPYGEIEAPNLRTYSEAVLDISEKPEGVDDTTWSQLMQLRQQKIEKENEILRKKVVLAEMAKHQEKSTERDNFLAIKFEEILRKFRQFHDKQLLKSLDLELLLKLKQGQVEVEQAAAVTDYSTSFLLPMTDIESLNMIIRSLGKEQVTLLKDMKNTKKLIRKKKWENKRLDMVSEDLIEKTKYFQLLRVTKQLQEMIKGGDEDLHAAELKTLESRSEHSVKSYEQKLAEKKRVIMKMKKLIREKEAENNELFAHLQDMEVSVSERQKIYEIQSQNTSTNPGGQPNKMKKIIETRKLKDQIRTQAEEIEELSKEVTRLRERAFPFIAATDSVSVGPSKSISQKM